MVQWAAISGGLILPGFASIEGQLTQQRTAAPWRFWAPVMIRIIFRIGNWIYTSFKALFGQGATRVGDAGTGGAYAGFPDTVPAYGDVSAPGPTRQRRSAIR